MGIEYVLYTDAHRQYDYELNTTIDLLIYAFNCLILKSNI